MTAKKLLIHIGHRNAGAEVLQNTLLASQEVLSDQDIYVPAYATDNHEKFTLGYRQHDEQDTDDFVNGNASPTGAEHDHWSRISDSKETQNCDIVVVSNKSYLRHLSAKTVRRFEQATNCVAEKKEVIAYLRPPGAHFLSLTQQKLSQGKELSPPSRTRVKERIRPLSEAWSGKITLQLFDEQILANGDIVDDFFARHLPMVDTQQLRRPKASDNAPISTEAMALLIDRMHGRLDDTIDPASMIRQIVRVDRKIPEPTVPVLRPAAERTLNNWAAPDLAWLRGRHDVRFPQLDYKDIDCDDVDLSLIHFIDIAQICEVNEDRKEALYQKALARAKLPKIAQHLLANW